MKIINKVSFEDKTIYFKKYDNDEITLEIEDKDGNTTTICRSKNKDAPQFIEQIFNMIVVTNRAKQTCKK